MIKRLLFVDDEPMVLDGLRRSLHCMRQEWTMKFVDSPAAAIDALDHEPFDAIISDMRMPGMDGAQLLEYVKEHHSDVVRIVLSGQSSKETVLRSMVPAHQFLSKPFDVEELKSRLCQAFAMRDLLRNEALASVVARLRSIPSLPQLYNELTDALGDENASLRQIEDIISKDVGMAAKIMQLANSAFIGAHTRVSSLHEAVSLVGAETVRSLTLSIHVFSQFDHNSSVADYLPAIWNHSVAVASLAQRIAIAETKRKSIGEESFTAGLLHDIGKIVLLAELPQDYGRAIEKMDSQTRVIRDLEIEFLGCPHEQIGAYLMSIWGLPISIMQAVEYHHCPSEATQTEFSSLTAVHCADAIASEQDELVLNRDVQFDTTYLQKLNLLPKVESWRAFYEEYLLARARREQDDDSIFRT